MAQQLGKIYVQIAANASQLVNEVGKVNKSLSSLEIGARNLKNSLLGIFGAYQIINGIQNTVRVLAEFDKTMTAVGVITNASKDDFKELERSAINLGSATQYTAKQVAELQLEFGRLGFSTKEILQSTKATVDLATATGEGLARSAEIAGSTLRAFQLDAQEMGRVTDVMAGALNNSALTLDSFADAIKYVSPVAKATGVSLEETAAMLSVLADAGIKGSQAGTSLRRIFTLLTNDGRPLQERLDELSRAGITLADANDEVGLYAQTALLQLTAMLPSVRELTTEYQNNTGATEQMARAMENNLATSITKVGTAWDSLILSFRESKGFLMGFFDGISEQLRLMAGGESADLIIFTRKLEGLQNALSDGNKIYKVNIQSLVTLAKQLGKELTVIEDNTGRIISVYELVRGGFVGPKLPSSQPLGADVMLELTRDRNKTEQENLDILKKQAKAYQDLIDKQNELGKALNKRELLSIAVRDFGLGSSDRSQSLRDSVNAGNTPLRTPEENKVSSITEEIEKIKELQFNYSELALAVRDAKKAKDEDAEAAEARTVAIMQSVEQIGDSISRAIQADQSLGRSMAAVSATIIEELERQALAAIIRNAAITSVNPFAAVAAATIGFSIIKGLFAKISKSKDGSSSANVGRGYSNVRGSAYTANGAQDITFVLRGQDIYGSLSNFQRNNRFTTAGG